MEYRRIPKGGLFIDTKDVDDNLMTSPNCTRTDTTRVNPCAVKKLSAIIDRVL